MNEIITVLKPYAHMIVQISFSVILSVLYLEILIPKQYRDKRVSKILLGLCQDLQAISLLPVVLYFVYDRDVIFTVLGDFFSPIIYGGIAVLILSTIIHYKEIKGIFKRRVKCDETNYYNRD